MKACAYKGSCSFGIEDRPVPEISDDEILVRTKVVGICGTDIHKAVHGTVPVGTVLGHEISGVVERAGSRVTSFSPGDRVAIQHHAPCMSCKACLKGHHSLCAQYLKTNVDPGGFSEFIRIMPENVKHTVKLMPDHVDFVEGAFMEPLSCCLRGFDRLPHVPGDNYLVVGLGPIGMLFCQIAKAFNAGSVTGVEIDSYRRQFALERLGVDLAHDPSSESWQAFAARQRVPPPDHVIVTVGIGKAYADALARARAGTAFLFFAECPGGHEITIDPNLVYRNELTVVGSYSSSPRYLTMAMDMISAGRVDVKALVTHEFPPERIGEAIELARAARDSLKVMVTF